MTNTKIDNDEAALAAADEIAALSNAVTQKEAALEARLQAVRDEFNVELAPMKARLGERTKAFAAYLRRKGVSDRLFDAGLRSGKSAKARFGFRDNPTSLDVLDGKSNKEQVARDLLAKGLLQYVIIPKTSAKLNEDAILADKLTPEQLASLGLRYKTSSKFYCELKDAVVTKKATCATPAA